MTARVFIHHIIIIQWLFWSKMCTSHCFLCSHFAKSLQSAARGDIWQLLQEARAFSVAGAQRLTEHLQDALQDLTAVRQQENDLLKRRVDLCHQELEDQVAELERSFHLKVNSMSTLET